MNKYKTALVLTLLLLLCQFTQNHADARCKRKKLQRTCNSCFQQALDSSECMSQSQTCPECPSCSLDITELTKKTSNNLRTTYTLSVALKGGGTHNYTLFIASVDDNNLLSYTASYLNTGQQLNAVGLVEGIRIYFMLPAVDAGTFFPLDCRALIDSTGEITSGLCNSIELNPFSGDLSSIGGLLSGR